MSDQPNANIVTSSFDRIQGSAIDPLYQPYNSFRIQNLGGNIVQGQLNKISLTEVMFPYTIPSIVNEQNDTFVINVYDVNGAGQITALDAGYTYSLTSRFYSGDELVAALNALDSVGDNEPMNNWIDWIWNPVASAIEAQYNGADWDPVNGGFYVEIVVPERLYNQTVATDANPFNFPNFWWTVGMRNFFATHPPQLTTLVASGTEVLLYPGLAPIGTPTGTGPSDVNPTLATVSITGSFYTGRYTDYIDLVSHTLCQAQYTRDSTTSQNTTRRDVIARIYVCNNISVVSTTQEGSRPFIIHRMFPVPKVMKWTADRSIDAIDLQLYDMYGQPIPDLQGADGTTVGEVSTEYYCGEADYAITLHVHEPGAETQSENIGYSYQ
jgi:hypothetical protein